MKIISYKYTAINDFGELKTGVAENIDHGFEIELNEMGYVIVEMKKEFNFKKKLNEKEIYLFSYEMYLMLSSGITIVDSLDLLSKEVKNKNMSSIAINIKEKLLVGNSLSIAMSEVGSFPNICLSLINIGEVSGTLEKVFEDIYIYYKEKYERKSQLKSNLLYPLILIISLLFAIVIIMKIVIPNFIEIYSQYDAELPKNTLIFINCIDGMNKKIYGVLSFIILISVCYRCIFKKKYGLRIDKYKLKIFKIYRMKNMLELSKILSILVSSQIQLYKAILIAKESIGNEYLRLILEEALIELKKGNSFSDYLYNKDIFPDIFKRFIYVGEKTGNLDETLRSLYVYLKQKYNLVVETASKLIEPMILVCVAIFIGFVALVILAPMENLMDIIM